MPSVPDPVRAPWRDERGIALVVAIFALVVVGAIVSGTYFVGALEQRTAFNAAEASRAFQAAEAGLETVIGDWDAATLGAVLPGDSVRLASVNVAGGGSYQVTVHALNPQLFLVRSTGRLGQATQVVSRLVRRTSGAYTPRAALVAGAAVQVADSARVDGTDVIPPGWIGCPAPLSLAGVRAAQLVTVDATASVGGAPPIVMLDASVAPAALTALVDSLMTMAAVLLPGGLYGGMLPTLAPGPPPTCNLSDPNNWGDPTQFGVFECRDYFPVFRRTGNLTLANGIGQGVLLVDGDVTLDGGVTYAGVIVARGRVVFRQSGNLVHGAIISASGSAPARLEGDANLRYSSCAVQRAATVLAGVRPILGRSFTRLF